LLLTCGGQLVLEFSGRRRGTRFESLYQVLPEMLDDAQRNDLRRVMPQLFLSGLLLSFSVHRGAGSPPVGGVNTVTPS
jgi:hypothetical protein